jgi:hypothetical protein
MDHADAGFSPPLLSPSNPLALVSSASIIVGVEGFGPAGGAALNDASASALALTPGATAEFATVPMAGFDAESFLLPGLVLGGSARRDLEAFRGCRPSPPPSPRPGRAGRISRSAADPLPSA